MSADFGMNRSASMMMKQRSLRCALHSMTGHAIPFFKDTGALYARGQFVSPSLLHSVCNIYADCATPHADNLKSVLWGIAKSIHAHCRW